MENAQQGRKTAARQVRVLIVDRHASFRSACKALLQTGGVAGRGRPRALRRVTLAGSARAAMTAGGHETNELDFVEPRSHNFIRLWRWEQSDFHLCHTHP